ncbi:MAG: helix-turn-helix domain-containing protein [Dehalococcoidia bacterium]
MEEKLTRTADGRYCPVRATLALVGQKWVARIVYELHSGKRRFNDLSATVGGCNSRTLRDRLKDLEDLGIVRREIVSATPPWVEYELTARGVELARALGPLASWGRDHLAGADVPADALDALGALEGDQARALVAAVVATEQVARDG